MNAPLVRLARSTSLVSLFKAGPTRSERTSSGRLLVAADRMAPKLRAAFLQAVAALQGAVDPVELEALLLAGRMDAALAMLDRALSAPGAWDPLKAVAIQAVQEAADAASAMAPKIPFTRDGVGALEVRFDVLNPRTAEYLRRYAADLATELSQGARAAVNEAARVAIRQGVMTGQGAQQTARLLRGAIGLTPQGERAAQNYEAALREGRMGDARGYRRRDRRYGHDTAPGTEDKIRAMAEAYRRKALADRALTISRTESIRALSIGQHELWAQQIREGRISAEDLHRKWIYTADSKVRDAHRTIPKRNPDGRGFNEPFDSELGPILYPGDPAAKPANTINCRCTVFIRVNPNAFAKPEAIAPPVVEPPKPRKPRAPRKPKAPPAPPPITMAEAIAGKRADEQAFHGAAEWDQSDQTLMRAMAKTPKLWGVKQGEPGKAHYDPLAHIVVMSPGNDWGNLPRTKRHEYGHAMDFRGEDTPLSVTPAAAEAFEEAKARWAKPDPDAGKAAGAELDKALFRARDDAAREAAFAKLAKAHGLPDLTLSDLAALRGYPGQTRHPSVRRAAVELVDALASRDIGRFLDPALGRSEATPGIVEVDTALSSAARLWTWVLSDFQHGWAHKKEYYTETYDSYDVKGPDGKPRRVARPLTEMFATYVETYTPTPAARATRAILRAMAPRVAAGFDRLLEDVANA